MGVANLGVHKQVAMGRLPITPRTADSLHVALEAWRQSQVQHSPNIWTVQAHPKCHCGHYDPQVALHEGLLHSPPFPAAHAGMVCFSYSLGAMTCREGEGMIDGTVAGTQRKGSLGAKPCLCLPLGLESPTVDRQVRSSAATRSVSFRRVQ